MPLEHPERYHKRVNDPSPYRERLEELVTSLLKMTPAARKAYIEAVLSGDMKSEVLERLTQMDKS